MEVAPRRRRRGGRRGGGGGRRKRRRRRRSSHFFRCCCCCFPENALDFRRHALARLPSLGRSSKMVRRAPDAQARVQGSRGRRGGGNEKRRRRGRKRERRARRAAAAAASSTLRPGSAHLPASAAAPRGPLLLDHAVCRRDRGLRPRERVLLRVVWRGGLGSGGSGGRRHRRRRRRGSCKRRPLFGRQDGGGRGLF